MARKKTISKPSPAIRAMQLKMQAAGQYSGPIDGLSGPKYEAAINRRDNAANRASKALELKAQADLAKAATAKALADKANAEARQQDNSWQNKVITLGGQGAAVGIGAYAGHKISSGTKKLMLASKMAGNRQIIELGKEAAPLVKKGIVNKGGAYYAKSLAGQLKSIKSPKTVIAGLGLSAFLAGDAAYSHFVGRKKAKESGSQTALMAVDAFTATTALASTANLAYTVQSAVMPAIQKETVAAAKVKAASAMADDFLANPKAPAVGKKSVGKSARGLKAVLQAALENSDKIIVNGNPKSPWQAGSAISKAARNLPGSAKLVGLAVAGAAGMAALTPNRASASSKNNIADHSQRNNGALGAGLGGIAYLGRHSIAKAAKITGRIASKFAGPVGLALTAYDVGSGVHGAYKDVQKMKSLDKAGQAKWHKDKRTAIAGGSLLRRFSALSPAQKAQFEMLDKAGRKAMLTGGGKSQGGAYLNKSAAAKAKTAPKAKAATPAQKGRRSAASPGKNGMSSYTKKDGSTVQVTAKQAASYRQRRR